MADVRIEQVGDVNTIYPYLEVCVADETSPFLEISISSEKELVYKFYPSQQHLLLSSVQ